MKRYFWFLILIIGISSCKKTPVQLTRIEGKLIPVDSSVANSKILDSIIAPYRDKVDKEMNIVLSYAPESLIKERGTAETNIGNFMADVCYERGEPIFNKKTGKHIDFVLLNFGGIRAGIPKGPVTLSSAYEVMPFENSMVVVEMSYPKIQELLNYLAQSGSAHPISKQLHLVFSDAKPVSAKLLGKDLSPKRTYYVLTSDYLQHGGDRMNFFKNPVSLFNLNYKIRNAIIDTFKAKDTIRAVVDGRIIRKTNQK